MNIIFIQSLPELLVTIFSFLIIGLLFLRSYKKQNSKPKVWIGILVLFVGLFTFSFNLVMFQNPISIPLLPLGVWIIYWVVKRKKDGEVWKSIRPYAWLGFLSNFIFLITSFLIGPLHNQLYPKYEVSTYISSFNNSEIIRVHPSANEASIDPITFIERLNTAKQARVDSIVWYQNTWKESKKEIEEKFPYQLIGADAKKGSGLESVIHIERDGKGVLIRNLQEQLYFRTEYPVIEIIEGGES